MDQDGYLNEADFISSVKNFCPILDTNNDKLMVGLHQNFKKICQGQNINFDEYRAIIYEENT